MVVSSFSIVSTDTGGQGRSPQRGEERGPILFQEARIGAHRLIGTEKIDFAGLAETVCFPLPVAGQALVIGPIGRRRIMIATHARTIEDGRADESPRAPSAGRYASKSATR